MTNKKRWFTISGLNVTVGHNDLTREIWDSYEKPKSEQGRQAVILFAESKGFVTGEKTTANDAFSYLAESFPGAGASWIIREALEKSQELLLLSSVNSAS